MAQQDFLLDTIREGDEVMVHARGASATAPAHLGKQHMLVNGIVVASRPSSRAGWRPVANVEVVGVTPKMFR
jgi:hypothetical protein